MDSLLQMVIQHGARLARPGEFSERAFLNGKIDLTQAEAIADLEKGILKVKEYHFGNPPPGWPYDRREYLDKLNAKYGIEVEHISGAKEIHHDIKAQQVAGYNTVMNGEIFRRYGANVVADELKELR